MQCVKDYIAKLTELRAIREKYGLDVSIVDELIAEIDEFKVTAPIIGNFSTGKSSMLNAVLGKRLVSVEITPETAVPTEIFYGDNTITRIDLEGNRQEYSLDELPLKDLSVKNTELVRIALDHPFLKQIENVKLVDLPGFDSGIELHNQAIDKYLPNSLAYILVVAVDEPVLKDNITNFVQELELHGMPLYVVLTKCSRLTNEEVKSCRDLVVGIISKIIKSEIKVACIESYGDVQVEGVKQFMVELQQNAERLFEIKYSPRLQNIIQQTELYLVEQINKKDMTLSELEEEKEFLQNDIADLLHRIKREREKFDAQADECVKSIKSKISNDLEAAASAIAAMVQNGNNVNEKINTIVRNAVTVGIKTEFEPRLQKYLKDLAQLINVDILKDDGIKMNVDQLSTDNMIQDVVMRAAPFVLAVVGYIINPVGAVIGGMIGAFLDSALNISQSKVKEKKAMEVTEKIISTVTEQAGEGVNAEIKRYIIDVNKEIEKEILRQKELLDKSLEDVSMRVTLEDAAKNAQILKIKNDVDIVKSLND